MTLQVFTGHMSKYNHHDYSHLNITVKSRSKVFAPTWDMVIEYKEGRITKEEYTEQYYSMMREQYRSNRSAWDLLLSMDRIVLHCYCKPGEFCHRVLLAEILVKLGAVYKGEI